MEYQSQNIAIDVDNSETSQLLRQAALFENIDLLEDLLKENPWAWDKVDRHERTLLMLAAHNGRVKSIQSILKIAPDSLELSNGIGKTALHMAAESGEADAVLELLNSGANPMFVDNNSHCALEIAQMAAHENVTAILIDFIQKENEELNELHDSMIAACLEGINEKVTEILETRLAQRKLNREIIFNGRNNEERFALMMSCTHGRLSIVTELLKYDEHTLFNQTTKDTVVHAAVSSQNVEVLKAIIEKYPQLVSEENAEGSTCLHWAARCGSVECVQIILSYDYPEPVLSEYETVGAPAYRSALDLNQGDGECRTPLFLAVAEGHLDVVKLMIEHEREHVDGKRRCPFRLDVYSAKGTTPLMMAAYNQSLPMLTLLLSAGADINLPLAILDGEQSAEEGRCVGSGALVEATRADAPAIINFLFEKGAVDTDNKALRLAAQHKNEKLMRLFVTRLVYPDAEYKINKKNIDVGQLQLGQSLLPSSICPSRAAQLNWQGAKLETVLADWFVAASLVVNPRLKTTRLALAAVTRVDLSDNMLSILPSALLQMPSLRSLNLSENRIKRIEIPSYSVTSTSLQILNLKDNMLEAISSKLLASFPQLETLDVSRNEIVQLPEAIWLCPALKSLDVSNNRISGLPDMVSVGERGRLQETFFVPSVKDGKVEDEPLTNVKVNPLRRKNVWQEQINLSKVEDAEDYGDLNVTSSNTLITLNLSYNKFHVFPKCLACTCPRLLTLNVSHNSITSLPPVQFLPAHLKTIDVSHNRLQDGFTIIDSGIPSVCHAVPATSNSASAMPRRRMSPQRQHRSRSKSAVRSQRSLSVSRHAALDSNQAEEHCIHKRHESLEWMKTLNMASNSIKNIKFLTGSGKLLFPNLNVLDLSNNKLTTAPTEIAKHSALSILNLSSNQGIRQLPPEFGMLSRLWSLSLKGCNLKDPLDTMVNTENCKTVDIIGYLKTILEESKKYHHLRLHILGGDEVGKSAVWEGLRSEAVQKKPPYQTDCGSVRVAEWRFEAKKTKGDTSNIGPIAFTAWDYGGQREYYSTHQYFLNRRALYLVLWKIGDGEEAYSLLDNWLINIQARALNATVILVGTFLDQIVGNRSKFGDNFLEDVEMKIKSRYMIPDADKFGLPRVCDVVFIDANSKSDAKKLLTAVYRSACEVKIGKERAVEQQVPSSYMALVKICRDVAAEMKKDDLPAVLTVEELKEKAKKVMSAKFGRPFRDEIEFNRACSFLNDCGEIIRFEDATLRDLVFIDPVWLAKFLNSLVALRSAILPEGLLSIESTLPIVKPLKSKAALMLKAQLLELLHKFELALISQPRQLLFPALLPDEYRLRTDLVNCAVTIPIRNTEWNIRKPSSTSNQHGTPNKSPLRRIYNLEYSMSVLNETGTKKKTSPEAAEVTIEYVEDETIQRLYSLAYVPSGFWARLVTRIMGDKNITHSIFLLFAAKTNGDEAELMTELAGKSLRPEWLVWQTGIELHLNGHYVFCLKQFLPLAQIRRVDYRHVEIRVKDEQKRWNIWRNCERRPLLELILPSTRMELTTKDRKTTAITDVHGRSLLIAQIVDLIDTLLEDWYPALGTRFVHSSEGDLLVSRLVPCTRCIRDAAMTQNGHPSTRKCHDDLEISHHVAENRMKVSRTAGDLKNTTIINCFTIEECMLAGREYGWVECPTHSGRHMKEMAPDTIFADIDEALVLNVEQIKRGRLLGRGAFGFVFRTTIKKMNGELIDAAQKMLEPVDPGAGARVSAVTAYKAAADKWKRDSSEFACRAYCTCRQELNLLTRLKHPNVVSLIGACTTPLSLVVELAPLGALSQLLASYRKSGTRLSLGVVKESAVQVARALEYLHSCYIIYRDLKSENVLCWRFPAPFCAQSDILLKLGDYGISRSIMPSGGAKGFGGTEGFMAPEIVRFNGEEEYTSKIDCFSYGMFLYELITLKIPYEGEEHVKERLLEGARPVLLPHELLLPTSILDLLVHCWSPYAENRPSSSQLVGFTSSPEFTHLLDVTELQEALPPTGIVAVSQRDDSEDPEDFEAQVWIVGRDLNVFGCTQFCLVDSKTISLPFRSKYVSAVRENVWTCDEAGQINVHSTSLLENGNLNLPSLNGTLIRAPELLANDVLLLVSDKQLVLLRLSETNSVSLLARFESPNQIRSAVAAGQTINRQIWTGHDGGRLSIHHLATNDTISFSSSFYLPEETVTVTHLQAAKDASRVWVATEKGPKVQCIDVEKRTVCSTLDIRKVMPASETIHTMDVEMGATNVVSCICLHEKFDGDHLYVATTRGLLIVAQAVTLQPLTAFRPYECEITSMCIVKETGRAEDGSKGRPTATPSVNSTDSSGFGWVRDRVSETVDRFRGAAQEPVETAALITVGRQFRSLSHRFVAKQKLSDVFAMAVWKTDDWTV